MQKSPEQLMNEHVYPAWNRRTKEYGIVITHEKYLITTIYRNNCYLQNNEEPLPPLSSKDRSDDASVYFLSFKEALNRRVDAIPIEKVNILERAKELNVQCLGDLQYYVGLLREEGEEDEEGTAEDIFGIAFTKSSQIGDFLVKTKYFNLLPDAFLLPKPITSQHVIFLPLPTILSSATCTDPFLILPRDKIRFFSVSVGGIQTKREDFNVGINLISNQAPPTAQKASSQLEPVTSNATESIAPSSLSSMEVDDKEDCNNTVLKSVPRTLSRKRVTRGSLRALKTSVDVAKELSGDAISSDEHETEAIAERALLTKDTAAAAPATPSLLAELPAQFIFLTDQRDRVKCIHCQKEFVFSGIQPLQEHIFGDSSIRQRKGLSSACPNLNANNKQQALQDTHLANPQQQQLSKRASTAKAVSKAALRIKDGKKRNFQSSSRTRKLPAAEGDREYKKVKIEKMQTSSPSATVEDGILVVDKKKDPLVLIDLTSDCDEENSEDEEKAVSDLKVKASSVVTPRSSPPSSPSRRTETSTSSFPLISLPPLNFYFRSNPATLQSSTSSSSSCSQKNLDFPKDTAAMTNSATVKENAVSNTAATHLPTIEEILAKYNITSDTLPTITSDKYPQFTSRIPSYIPDTEEKFILSTMFGDSKEFNRKEFNRKWTVIAKDYWMCIYPHNDHLKEAYFVPRFLVFAYSAKILHPIQNIDFFYLKDMQTHIREHQCLCMEDDELWQLLQSFGWKEKERENHATGVCYYYSHATRYVSKLTMGFHQFHSWTALIEFVHRFPYPLQPNVLLMSTLQRWDWEVDSNRMQVNFHNRWRSLEEMREIFWSYPHLFFHHRILPEEEDRVLLSLGLPKEYAQLHEERAETFPPKLNRTFTKLLVA